MVLRCRVFTCKYVLAITGDGKSVVTLTEALEYEHLGVTETYTDSSGNSHSFDYRGNSILNIYRDYGWVSTLYQVLCVIYYISAVGFVPVRSSTE